MVGYTTTRNYDYVRGYDVDFGGFVMNTIVTLTALDIVGITIALVTSMALIITSATANARLTRERNYWRDEALRHER